MTKKSFKAIVISDFNTDVFTNCLNNDECFPSVSSISAPFGQVTSFLIGESHKDKNTDYDFAVVWTQPEGVIESFKKALSGEETSIDEILKEVDDYSRRLINFKDRVRFIFVPTWVSPSYYKNFGIMDMKDDLGIENIIMQMNLRLSKNITDSANIYLLNSRKWFECSGRNAFSPKMWYMAKIPFGNDVFKEAKDDIKSHLLTIMGKSKKMIIVDLDDTLWGGIVGDIGWENINLGGHDHIGESYADFQRSLKALTKKGILLGIVSKNEESIAVEAIKRHPEMALRLEDFAGWRINWEDKAKNIVNLVSDLNLGLESVVFIDDNPSERLRVRQALPEVLVPEWPEDKMLYKKALVEMRCFDAISVTKEDLERSKMYIDEKNRKKSERSVGSMDEWLKSLDIKVNAQELNEANLQRSVQLLNKTNQMNLATRRLSAPELTEWLSAATRRLWTFSVSDKFGDSGLTGMISLEVDNKIGRIIDFVLSCRVIGREIEKTMVYVVFNYARSIKLEALYAEYIETAKNKPCLEFWKRSGFDYVEKENLFRWDMAKDYSLSPYVTIKGCNLE